MHCKDKHNSRKYQTFNQENEKRVMGDLECFRAQFCCVRTQSIDIHQKKYGFYAKIGCNPLQICKIVVPLHRQKEQTGKTTHPDDK